MPLLRNLPNDVLREEAAICKKFPTAKSLLQAEPAQFAPLTQQEAKALKVRVARACAPFAQTGLQAYKEFVRNSSVVPTGIPNIDVLLSGGLFSGQIVEIFGKSGSGKSEFCHRVAANVSASLDKVVLYMQTKGDFCPRKIERIVQAHCDDGKGYQNFMS
jgi:RecA/RadA recombinase